MSRIGGAYYELSVESSKFTRGLKDAEDQASRTTTAIEGGLNLSFSRMSVAIAGATAAAAGIVAVIQSIQERLYDGAIKAEEFGQKLNLANAHASMRALNEEIGRLQTQLGSQSGIISDFTSFLRGEGASFQIKDQIKELEAIRSTIDNRLQRQRDEQDIKSEEEAERRRIESIRRQAKAQEDIYRSLIDTQNRQDLDRLDGEEKIRLETEVKVDEYRRRVQKAGVFSPEVQSALQRTIDEEYRLRDQKIGELNRKRQEDALKESAKIMADAMKEFGKYVEKLEQIQRSWNEGFTGLENAGVREIKTLLEGWGPSIRSL